MVVQCSFGGHAALVQSRTQKPNGSAPNPVEQTTGRALGSLGQSSVDVHEWVHSVGIVSAGDSHTVDDGHTSAEVQGA